MPPTLCFHRKSPSAAMATGTAMYDSTVMNDSSIIVVFIFYFPSVCVKDNGSRQCPWELRKKKQTDQYVFSSFLPEPLLPHCHLPHSREITNSSYLLFGHSTFSLFLQFLKLIQRLKRGHIGYINSVQFVYEVVSFGAKERQLGWFAVLGF